MIDLPTMTDLKLAVQQTECPELTCLLAERLEDTIECGLQELTHVLVIQANDSEADIVEAIGFSPLRSRIENRPNCADWDWIERHDGWWELLYTVGNSGFAYILLVQDDDRSALARLCRREAA